MKNLSEYTIVELEQELKNKFQKLRHKKKPGILYNAKEGIKGHFNPLIDLVKRHVDSRAAGQWHEDDDDAHYIYEMAVEMVYGKQIWDQLIELEKVNEKENNV